MTRVVLAVWIVALAAGTPASAHHSFAAEYYEQQKVSVEGDVVQFDYMNPHSWIRLTAKDANGEIQRFSAEWLNPGGLAYVGVTAESIKPGDHVIVTGSPGHNRADHKIRLRAIERPSDGWKWSSYLIHQTD